MEQWKAEDFVSQAENALERAEPESARDILEQAVSRYPNHIQTLELLGVVYSDLGESDRACTILGQLVTNFPNASPVAWLQLGQLLTAHDSLQAYKRGCEILETTLVSAGSSERLDISNKLVGAYCAMFELYTSDCCDDADAEEQCEKLLAAALRLDANSPDVYVCLANLRFIQERIEESMESLDRFLQLYKSDPELKKGNCAAAMSYEVRISGAKILMELGRFEESSEILEQLISEDDRDAEIWYLCGVAYSSFEPETAIQYLQHCIEKAEKDQCSELRMSAEELLKDCMKQVQASPQFEGEVDDRMDL